MPRKVEPSFSLKQIIWDIAATISRDNYSAIRREVEQKLRQLHKNDELWEDELPDIRVLRRIVDLDIQRLPREVVVSKLPRHVWLLRNDYEEIIGDLEEIQGGDQKQKPMGEKGQLSVITETITIKPFQKSSLADPESLVGAKYLNITIPSNDIWIESITITTSHPRSAYTFLVFDRKQPEDFYSEEDVFLQQRCYTRRTQYIQPKPQRYHDADECKHLHCGFEHEGHPRDFRMDEQELKRYFRQPVTYTVRLEYKSN
jgi:hypothetical protein